MTVKTNKLKPNKTQINLIARALDNSIKEFFDDPTNRKALEDWKEKREVSNGKVNTVD